MRYDQLFTGVLLISLSSCTKELPPTEPPPGNTVIYYNTNSSAQVVSQIFNYNGQSEVNLTNDLMHNYWWIKVSGDKAKFLCYRSPKVNNNYLDNKSNDYANADLMVFNIDGTNPRVIIQKGKYGWSEQGVAKFSPDGTKILMAALCVDPASGNNDLHWRLIVTDVNGNNPKIISTRNSLFADPAW